MNANEISPKAGARMDRIRMVSRIAMFIAFCFLAFTIWFLLRIVPDLFRQRNSGIRAGEVLGMILQSVVCVWYWELAQLFRLYERGQIFAAATIRCIKFLGLLCAAGWMLKLVTHIWLQQHPLPSIQSMLVDKTVPPGVTTKVISITHYQMGFFSFDFGTGVDFGLLFAGIVIVLIAWIMDEGRKIQEEQELTV